MTVEELMEILDNMPADAQIVLQVGGDEAERFTVERDPDSEAWVVLRAA
jgi:hypothetical protein